VEYDLPVFPDIDECHTITCLHGTCEDGVNSFTCHCEPGYEGKLCDISKWESGLIEIRRCRIRLHIVSPLEHTVLMVSYYERPLSVVRRHLSSINILLKHLLL